MKRELNVYFGKINVDNWSLYLATTEKGVCFIGRHFNDLAQWLNKKHPGSKLIEDPGKIAAYANQLEEYFTGRRKVLDLPLDMMGTSFQKAVWQELQKIPYGETASYAEIAERVGKPKAVRAIGGAVGANPILIAVPCHRVIRKSGELGGYREGLSMKRKLLKLENMNIDHRTGM